MTAYTAMMTVRLKRDVLDSGAETTKRALERLGFELEALHFTEYCGVDLDVADVDGVEVCIDKVAERLLADLTIHDYGVAVAEARDDCSRIVRRLELRP